MNTPKSQCCETPLGSYRICKVYSNTIQTSCTTNEILYLFELLQDIHNRIYSDFVLLSPAYPICTWHCHSDIDIPCIYLFMATIQKVLERNWNSGSIYFIAPLKSYCLRLWLRKSSIQLQASRYAEQCRSVSLRSPPKSSKGFLPALMRTRYQHSFNSTLNVIIHSIFYINCAKYIFLKDIVWLNLLDKALRHIVY